MQRDSCVKVRCEKLSVLLFLCQSKTVVINMTFPLHPFFLWALLYLIMATKESSLRLAERWHLTIKSQCSFLVGQAPHLMLAIAHISFFVPSASLSNHLHHSLKFFFKFFLPGWLCLWGKKKNFLFLLSYTDSDKFTLSYIKLVYINHVKKTTTATEDLLLRQWKCVHSLIFSLSSKRSVHIRSENREQRLVSFTNCIKCCLRANISCLSHLFT